LADRSDTREELTIILDAEAQDPGNAELVFAAHTTHDPSCWRAPRTRNTDNPGLCYGYFENHFGEQFVFTFDRASGTGTVSGGDIECDNSKAFTLGLVEEALRATQRLAAQVVEPGRNETPALPIIDAALALGRLTALTGKDEVIWLRACLRACARPVRTSEGGEAD